MDATKPTNPKDVLGSNKLPFHLWPETASAMGSIALLDGASGNTDANWRVFRGSGRVSITTCITPPR